MADATPPWIAKLVENMEYKASAPQQKMACWPNRFSILYRPVAIKKQESTNLPVNELEYK